MNTFHYTTVSRTVLGDLYTPVGVYLRLRDLYPQSALMECSDYHDANESRSFIGVDPIASVAIGHGIATITYPDGSVKRQEVNNYYRSDNAVHDLIDNIVVSGDNATVFGLFGYTSFNAVRYFENINVKDETQEKNDAPDLLYILYKVVIVFDHHGNMLKVVSLKEEKENNDTQDNDSTIINSILKAMNKANVQTYDFHPIGDVRSTLTDEEHKANISAKAFNIACVAMYSRLYSVAGSFKPTKVTISNSIVPCAASTPVHIFSSSTLAVSVSLVHHQRHIAELRK